MRNMIFISYRRDDTSLVARALAETLRYRLGADKVFLDEDSLQDGEIWTDRLEKAVTSAKVVLVLIGSDWLTASDKFGRRRLDIEGDWVRKELVFANQHNAEIIPLLIGEKTIAPSVEGLPDALSWLSTIQIKRFHNDYWHSGVTSLIGTLINHHSFVDIQREREPVHPEPSIKKREEQALNEIILTQELEQLEGWEPIESRYPPKREIRKLFHFKSFKAAIEFMMKAVPSIQECPVHHPRWENQFKTVTVYFSTWDAGSKITKYDIDAAKMMDKVYMSFKNLIRKNRQPKYIPLKISPTKSDQNH